LRLFPPILLRLAPHCVGHGTRSSCQHPSGAARPRQSFNFAASESRAYFEPLVSLPWSYIQASFCPHLWVFKQAGHSNDNLRPDSEPSLIFSVVRPVGTTLLVFGHRIIISGILYYCIPASFIKPQIADQHRRRNADRAHAAGAWRVINGPGRREAAFRHNTR
jgi:hypothetical protein